MLNLFKRVWIKVWINCSQAIFWTNEGNLLCKRYLHMSFSNFHYLGPSMVFKPATLTQLSKQGIYFHSYIQFCLPSASLLLITYIFLFLFTVLSHHRRTTSKDKWLPLSFPVRRLLVLPSFAKRLPLTVESFTSICLFCVHYVCKQKTLCYTTSSWLPVKVNRASNVHKYWLEHATYSALSTRGRQIV